MTDRPEIQTVLCTLPWSPEEIDHVRQAFKPANVIQCSADDDAAMAKVLQTAQVALLAGDIGENLLVVDAPHLKWIHCDHAGLNKSARPEVFEKGFLVTSSAGRSAPALAQHAFFFALAFTYDIRNLLSRQAAHEWHQGREELREGGALWGRRLGILGFGHTGKEMARLGRAFGMHVTVLRRRRQRRREEAIMMTSCLDVDMMLSAAAAGGNGIDSLLDCDVIMLAAGLSDDTHHIFGADQFRRMKSTAIIINMSRGSLIDENALTDALRAGEIAGAGLDVFETEPLPKDSPLWDLPNVYITPHSTPQMPDRTARSIRIICENVKRYRAGQTMLNLLEERDMYTKGNNAAN